MTEGDRKLNSMNEIKKHPNNTQSQAPTVFHSIECFCGNTNVVTPHTVVQALVPKH